MSAELDAALAAYDTAQRTDYGRATTNYYTRAMAAHRVVRALKRDRCAMPDEAPKKPVLSDEEHEWLRGLVTQPIEPAPGTPEEWAAADDTFDETPPAHVREAVLAEPTEATERPPLMRHPHSWYVCPYTSFAEHVRRCGLSA